MNSNRKPELSRLKTIVGELNPELINLRRSIHREPEIGWQEKLTTRKITEFLGNQKNISLSYPLNTGLLAEIVNRRDAPFLAFRADIDALPIEDQKDVSYRSVLHGVCHACGHDVHTTVGCGILMVLSRLQEDLPVNVRVIFQPAEEPIPSGAPVMIDKGALETVQTVLAMHVDPGLSLGTIGLTEGWVNAQSVRLDWKIEGFSGHSARPEQAKNPIPVAAEIVTNIEKLLNRINSADEEVKAFAFTGIESDGKSYNTIPESVRLTATLRVTSESVRERVLDQIRKNSRAIHPDAGFSINFTPTAGSPPVINDPRVVGKILKNLESNSTLNYRIINDLRSKGGDDFGWYTWLVPGALIRFGTATDKLKSALHTTRFDVPEEIIADSILLFSWQILNWK